MVTSKISVDSDRLSIQEGSSPEVSYLIPLLPQGSYNLELQVTDERGGSVYSKRVIIEVQSPEKRLGVILRSVDEPTYS